MTDSDPVRTKPTGAPDPGDFATPGPVADPVGRLEVVAVSPEGFDAFLDWRAGRLDDDPALADAWRRFSREVAPLLRAMSRRGRRSLFEIEDATQEAWLGFLEGLGPGRARFDDGGSKAWLSIVIGKRVTNLKRRAAWRLEDSLEDEDASALIGREEDPAIAYERGRVRTLVREVLDEARDRVTGPSHRIVILRWIERRTVPEIAEALGMTASQVHDRHRRAIPVLRALLTRRFGEDPAGFLAKSFETETRDLDQEEVTP